MKILFISPHLSTGGLPQYLYYKVSKLIHTENKIYVIEYSDISGTQYVVQKNRLRKLLNENLYTLSGNDDEKEEQLFKIIDEIKPDIIHLEEFSDLFLPFKTATKIFSKDRKYKLIETSHTATFNPAMKQFLPDGFSFISPFHAKQYDHLGIPYKIVEYPIENFIRPNRESSLQKLGLDPDYYHVLHVGLFTATKNQKELFEIAKMLRKFKIQFHFVGNQAINFKSYWEPLMKSKPDKCVVWGERDDVDSFYSSMDLFYFASKGDRKVAEANPLVIREALSWGMKVLMYNMESYCGQYDNNPNIEFLEDDLSKNAAKVLNSLKYKGVPDA